MVATALPRLLHFPPRKIGIKAEHDRYVARGGRKLTLGVSASLLKAAATIADRGGS